jgi:16S rRNA (cytosine1402-N4)-methyltransferase
VIVRRMNYAGVARLISEVFPDGADVLLADLGLSSMQIDDPSRGFTFKVDGPLDMRMDPTRGRTAFDLLSTVDETGLAGLLAENSDEPDALELARAILQAHARKPITSTRSLAAVVKESVARQSRRSARANDGAEQRVFQALRIAVNDELGSLTALLRNLPSCLKPGGRVAILSFHSGEDRRVKSAFRNGLRDGTYSSIATEVIRASSLERRENPRSSAAKLRYAVRR